MEREPEARTEEPPGSGDLSPAGAVFAEFLARIEDGEAVDFAAFCNQHAALRADLEPLHRRWLALRGAFGDVQQESVASAVAALDDSGAILLEPDDASRSRLLRDLVREEPERPRYAIAGEWARGGMAAILKARDQCLRRTLAMKVLLAEREPGAGTPGLRTDPRSLARFLEEAQITGQLDHPGIPPVHELGIDAQGRVFFTMPLIKGKNLSQVFALARAQQEGWSLPRAVSLLQRVCETVAYAHSRGVVHRDLKPANVMVGRFGETYVMDWGLAKVHGRQERHDLRPDDLSLSSIRTLRGDLDAETPDSPLITMDGHVVGTPAYMAPEQARGELERVGPAADVYSIGAMLYELLAGQMPYVPSGVRLSARTVLARVLEGPPAALDSIRRDLPDELVAVCEKAMARELEQRYRSVVELGDDLRAWLEGRVVRAHQTGTWAELRKWIGRNRALAVACAALVLALVLALAVTIVLGGRATSAAGKLAAELRLNNLERGRLFAQAGNVIQAERLLWPEHLGSPDALETRWVLWDLHARHPCLATANSERELKAAVLTGDGSSVVTGDVRGRLQVLDVATLGLRAVMEPPEPSPVLAVAADPSGSQLFSAHEDGALHVWELPAQRLLRTLREPATRIAALDYCAVGARLLAGGRDGGLRVYDTKTWSMASANAANRSAIRRVAWSRDGTYYGSISNDWWARVYRAASGESVAAFHCPELPNGLAFAPDDKLVFGGNDRVLYTLDVADNQVSKTITKPDAFSYLAFAAGGSELLACGWQRIDVWAMPEGRRLKTIEMPFMGIMLVEPAGRRAVTVHAHEVRVWDLENRGQLALDGHEGRVTCRISPDGRGLASGDSEGNVRLFDLAEPTRPPRILGKHEGRVRCLAFSPDGSRLLSGGLDGRLRVWEVGSGQLLRTFDDHDDVTEQSASWSPDGRAIGSGVRRKDGCHVVVRELESGAERLAMRVETEQVLAVAFAPDGERLAYTSRGNGVRLCNLTGRQLAELRTQEQCWTLAFRPDGRRLATGTWGRVVEIFDPSSGAREQVLEGHAGTVWSIHWPSHDPRLFYTAAADGRVRLWDLAANQVLLVLEPFGSGYDALAVHATADGSRFAASGASPTAFVWDVAYYERHIAGNVEAQLARLAPEPAGAARIRTWAREVLARPWPR